MLGEILFAIMEGAVQTDNNEVTREGQRTAYNIELERTKQAKESTKRVIVEGIFDFLNSCANDSQTRR